MKLEMLKIAAKKHYIDFINVVDEMDCGNELAKQVSSRALNSAIKFNETMDLIATIDKNCPTARL